MIEALSVKTVLYTQSYRFERNLNDLTTSLHVGGEDMINRTNKMYFGNQTPRTERRENCFKKYSVKQVKVNRNLASKKLRIT